MRTDAEVLHDYIDLVSHVLWTIQNSPDLPGQARKTAKRLFADPAWKGKVVGTYVAHTLRPNAEREAIYGAMLDMGFELPSLLEPSRSLKDGEHE